MKEALWEREGRWIGNGLGSRLVPVIAALLGIVLTFASVTNGLMGDDYFHREVLREAEEFWVTRPPITGMFSFIDGNIEDNLHRMNGGGLPWWTWPELSVAFFRPLSALTHMVDYRLWPDSPMAMHIHSLAWFAALLFLVASLFRKMLLPAWVAGLAALFYAMDESHALPAGWLANRNAYVAAVFGVLSLIQHLRWRHDGRRSGALLAPLCLFAALLGGESAVAVGAYIFAYEVTLGKGSPWRRAGALVPYIVAGGIWRIGYQATGLGVAGSASYLDPIHNPLQFGLALLKHLPILLQGQWTSFEADFYSLAPSDSAFFLWILAIVTVAVLVILLIPLLRRDATARFWGLGMLLALAPVSATFPSNRLLVFAAVGGMALLAQFVAGGLTKANWLPASRFRRYLTMLIMALLFLSHAIIAPMRLPRSSTIMARLTRSYLVDSLPELTCRPENRDKTVFFVNSPSITMAILIPYIRTELAEHLPDRCHALASGLHRRVDISRVDTHTLEIEPSAGFASARIDRLFRNPDHPMHPGDRVNLDDFNVEVLSTMPDGRPRRARFRFSHPLEHPSYLFVEDTGDGLIEFELPPIGHSISMPMALSIIR